MTSWLRPLRSLELRFALAFLAVAASAVAVLGILVLLAARGDVSTLVREEQDVNVDTIAGLAASAYDDAGDWVEADIDGVMTLAEEHDAAVSLFDAAGRPVAQTAPVPEGDRGRAASRDVVVEGNQVGTVTVTFRSNPLPSPERHLRDALTRQIGLAAALAAVVAVVGAILFARRVSRPIVAVGDAAQALARGDRGARVGKVAAPGEVGELAVTFDRMAETIDRGESLRRTFLADIAHELRTPLTILQATLEAMTDHLVEPTPTALSALRDDVLRLERVVTDLETLAQAEAAGLRLETTTVDLADVAASALDSLRPQLEAAGLEADAQLQPAVIEGDPHRLHQIVTNLLTNALKFTAEGGVRVVVAPAGDRARLDVADTGQGIPSDELPHVFDRFWRGAGAHSKAGSGLGLTVVVELVEAHRGTVSVDSTVGRGTTVTVTFPRA
jgi:two-component system sensor histidine kinase BaeS